ncbi:hypothetical protein B0682_01420 [Moraxella lincolnii]|uniref:Glycine zipper family protein n=1 Tax=Lwoffella lincolnii TaxID=90241 RepID=A0A1T0CJI6_9GAMM|nr:hypothetical protein [Moraxella lincolnii]OOS22484.1 hypothetical protein B0682_01420 [Moraxella lincolnii]
MKLMSKIAVASLASTLTVSAMAEVTQPALTTPSTESSTEAVVFNNQLDTADLNYAFGGNQDLQVQAMTSQEMDETQGAWVQYAGAGLVGGYLGYMGYASSVPRSERTWGGVATAMGSGAVGGALTLTPIGITRAAFLGGTVGFVGNQAAISSSQR